jgi:predicted house-cleaning noncanonical NTP pyrophosphatase (MazG superfamily)
VTNPEREELAMDLEEEIQELIRKRGLRVDADTIKVVEHCSMLLADVAKEKVAK